jgi:hypothetical protein
MSDPERLALEERRATFRGFRGVNHFLHLAAKALEMARPPGWVWREYRAIFKGEMWRKQR